MKRLFLEADELGQWTRPHGPHETWSDHGMGLLVTLANQHGYPMDTLSLKGMHSWAEYRMAIKGYDLLVMNVRSWRYIYAKRAAEIFKMVNPKGQVWAGGMHCTVAMPEMEAVPQFDVIVSGQGEGTLLELLRDGGSSERVLKGHVKGYEKIDDLPYIDRTVWPKPPRTEGIWPLEGPGGWGPGPRAATLLTSRSCPMHCSFCYPAERNHFGPPRRRSVGNVLGELRAIEQRWGDFSMVLFHDSEFLMHPRWLDEFIERYPSETPARPFWASCRADMMAKWPERVKALRDDCHWHCFSIGLESGSQKVLDIMNKETTVAQNMAAIEMVNSMVDEALAKGERPPVIFANVMLATPGEEPEDAFATIKMLGKIKRVIPSLSWFTPYPGSTLGDRMIAEGRSLDSHKRYLRFPNEAKLTGIDYQFYVDLMNGKYDREVGLSMRQLMSRQGSAGEALE